MWDIGLGGRSRLRSLYHRLVVPRIDAIMVLGSNQKSVIESRWNSKCRIEVIHHHIDTDFFRPLLNAANGPVLSVGEDVGRDFDCLLGAAPGLKAPILIKARDPSALARQLSEWLSFPALRDLYARSSVVVVPLLDTANASGVGTVLEAMAMAKPLVVSDSAGIGD